MKITPIEIRQHTFQRVLRGYDVEEVGAFLSSLSNEWERVLNENKMLKMQLEIAEKDLNKLREVELTMFRMLKTAEDTSAQMTEQAKVAAEQYIEDARQKGEDLVNDARKKANMLVVDAENQSKYVREEILGEFKNHERDFKAMEKYRDNLIVQLKTLANNTVDSIERFEKKFSQVTVQEKFNDLRIQVTDSLKIGEDVQKVRLESEKAVEEVIAGEAPEESVAAIEGDATAKTPEDTAAITEAEVAEETVEESKEEPTEQEGKPDNDKKIQEEGSFFDQI
ncbi:DivIVA domain-containing protein [Runella slithyformis]|uniref:DivIVA domain protein n=1 Tax=Runella slithyformis (strain ATCC 29530 / DSM 19594 / LMG 11500 / NCIMB 11436 / LSU 4) TaxID=761193 RepID=A0A7U4E621_RUNSL|nr:DivIVA domain-containing protein [Runella slithyformis]AEI48793.1 DivIVA domain protein [Runella slithyformis DSM 19594]